MNNITMPNFKILTLLLLNMDTNSAIQEVERIFEQGRALGRREGEGQGFDEWWRHQDDNIKFDEHPDSHVDLSKVTNLVGVYKSTVKPWKNNNNKVSNGKEGGGEG